MPENLIDVSTSTVLGWLVALLGSVLTFVFTQANNTFSQIRRDQEGLKTRIQTVETLVAGEYIKRAEVVGLVGDILHRLDRNQEKAQENFVIILERLNEKADR